jgi:hypothetical protein
LFEGSTSVVTPITTISGISKRRAELLGGAHLGTIPELAAASPETVHDLLVAAGHRVSRSTVERWLVEARAIEAEQWHRAASFVVSFESRGDNGEHERERRTVVEQTEVDAGLAPTEQWRGWECSHVCEWMLARVLPLPESPDEERVDLTVPSGDASERRPSGPSPNVSRSHRIVGTVLVGRTGRRSKLVEDGRALAVGSVQDLERVALTIEPGAAGSTLVAVRLRSTATGARIVAGPAELGPHGRAELTMPDVPPDAYDVAVVVWDEQARAAPDHISVPLVVEPL